MKIPIQSSACIENALSDFGTPEQRTLWCNWYETNYDDDRPMSEPIRDLVLKVLRNRYDFLLDTLRSPVLTPNEVTYYASIAGIVYATACSVSVSRLHWRTF